MEHENVRVMESTMRLGLRPPRGGTKRGSVILFVFLSVAVLNNKVCAVSTLSCVNFATALIYDTGMSALYRHI